MASASREAESVVTEPLVSSSCVPGPELRFLETSVNLAHKIPCLCGAYPRCWGFGTYFSQSQANTVKGKQTPGEPGRPELQSGGCLGGSGTSPAQRCGSWRLQAGLGSETARPLPGSRRVPSGAPPGRVVPRGQPSAGAVP
ncbi:PREDICTED: placenta-specific gene 8 protein isoform X1 [Rhinopithecus bieti]|uniref:placenta-specific gene 8 protein isoform X1 n=1 Tax=Rhinopithecus bieti TaxID=61621 RepID=UPI00083BF5EC|nr:PREDICTED: placenta-specific gene 8 protein isoform X1 [Rhinopithecus bieti]